MATSESQWGRTSKQWVGTESSLHSSSIQYTIRGIPPEVDRELRREAAQRRKSLNQLILEELTVATTGSRRRADFSDLVGRWTPDAAFDEILASQRQIDWDKRK